MLLWQQSFSHILPCAGGKTYPCIKQTGEAHCSPARAHCSSDNKDVFCFVYSYIIAWVLAAFKIKKLFVLLPPWEIKALQTQCTEKHKLGNLKTKFGLLHRMK